MTLTDLHTKAIKKLCRQHKVKRLYAFGSVVSGDFTDESDIDLIVVFEPQDVSQYADNYFKFKFELEAVLKRPVDLLEEHTIKNPFFKKVIENHQQLIYAN